MRNNNFSKLTGNGVELYVDYIEVNNGCYGRDYLYGFVNENDEVVIPHKYPRVEVVLGDLAIVCKCDDQEKEWKVINAKGEIVYEYDKLNWFEKELKAAVCLNGKWGVINEHCEVVCPIKYEDIGWFDEKIFIVRQNGKWGAVNYQDEVVYDFKYDDFEDSVDELFGHPDLIEGNTTVWCRRQIFRVRLGDKWGFINADFTPICEFKYDKVDKLNDDGYALVKIGDKIGIIDDNGDEILSPRHANYYHLSSNGILELQEGELWGWYDVKSKYLCEPKYDETSEFNSIFIVKLNGKYGIVQADGTELLPLQYDEFQKWWCYGRKSTAYMVQIGEKWGVIDVNTREYIFEPIYDEISDDDECCTQSLRLGDKWCYIYLGESKNIVSDIIYDEIKCNGQVVEYRLGDKWGVHFILRPDSWAPEDGCAIEEAGKVIDIFECKYDACESGGWDRVYYLSLSLNGKCGYFSVSRKDGSIKMICEHKYDKICFDVGGMAAVRIGDKWGYIDGEGKAICEIKYDDVGHSAQPACYDYEREDFEYPHLIAVCIGDKWGFINTQGEEFCEFKFDRVERWTSEYDGDWYEAYIGEQRYALSEDGLKFEPRG